MLGIPEELNIKLIAKTFGTCTHILETNYYNIAMIIEMHIRN